MKFVFQAVAGLLILTILFALMVPAFLFAFTLSFSPSLWEDMIVEPIGTALDEIFCRD